MNHAQANKKIRQLARDGHPYEEIAALLHADGYKSRLGRPLTKNGVNQRAIKLGVSKGRGRAMPKHRKKTPVMTHEKSPLDIVRGILTERGMSAQRKIEICLLIIDRNGGLA